MSSITPHKKPAPLEERAELLLKPLSRFARHQAASGILLGVAVIAALWAANSSYATLYDDIKHLHVAISAGDSELDMSLKHWINDGLMVLFFFLLGLEIKRELLAGELQDLRQSGLVLCMALGGKVVPALTYLGINYATGADAARGWGIPMATDTAFAIGILAALGTRVPKIAIVMVSALAIIDDIGAILVISIFYTENIDITALGYAAACLAGLVLLNLSGFRRAWPYLLFGVGLWFWILESGVHATTAGVLAALAIPTRPHAGTSWFSKRIDSILKSFKRAEQADAGILHQEEQRKLAMEARSVATQVVTPLQRWEATLDKPVGLLIIPIFAFLNAGVALPDDVTLMLTSPVSLAIVLGLVLGKSLGITLFAGLGIKLGLGKRPDDLLPGHILGIGLLAGIGFTMSLFINSLAFDSTAIEREAKLGILLGSLAAAIIGVAVLLWVHRRCSSS
jgi:NhaA family Na+:H+ antiporter